MAETTIEQAGLHLIDGETGERIDPSHLRAALSGDVYLTRDLDEMPPQHVDVELTVVGKVAFPVTLKETKEAGVAAVFTVKVERQTSWRVLPKAEDPGLFDDERWADAAEGLSVRWSPEQLEQAARHAREDLGWSVDRFSNVLERWASELELVESAHTADVDVSPWAVVSIAASTS
jgi:hypothetical protein